jgi:hypothetical protein
MMIQLNNIADFYHKMIEIIHSFGLGGANEHNERAPLLGWTLMKVFINLK